jgi:hypothetical protein
MLISLIVFLAQRGTHQPADEGGSGLLYILIGVAIAAAVAVGIFLVFTKGSKRGGGTGPDRDPHDPDAVGSQGRH